jgi:serine/threonine-protein kinase HipA
VSRCLITYDPIPEGTDYSARGLRLLHSRLSHLDPLPFTNEELIQEAVNRSSKMSVQGIQPKLSAVLRVKEGRFELVDQGGRFILKPPNAGYPELPENEDVTMKLAKAAGLEVPDHGLVRAKDEKLVYWIRRFDRAGQKGKLAVEDFAQLSGKDRETKYKSSVEQVIDVIEKYCTFPLVEKKVFFERFLFNYLVGNEDMHLKNYAVITDESVVRLAPCFDFLNSTIVLKEAREESALPLGGKKSGFTRNLLVEYLAAGRLGLTESVIKGVLQTFQSFGPVWKTWIERSFLSAEAKERYCAVLGARFAGIFEGPKTQPIVWRC